MAGPLLVLGLWVLGLAGCATKAVEPRSMIYGAIALPENTEAIGLTVARPAPEFTLQLPETRRDASHSVADAGARDMARDPYVAAYFPLGYVLGGIMGGMLGVSEPELESATRSLGAAIQEMDFDHRLAQMVRDHLNAILPGRISDLADNLPMEPVATHGHMRRDESGRMLWFKHPPAPHPLAGSSLDTVIGLRVTYFGFQARSNPHVRSTGDMEKINPPLSLVLSADVTAVRVKDWADLGGVTASYESVPRKFIEWAATDAQPLRREFETGLQEIRRQVARQLTHEAAPAGSTFASARAFP